MKNELMMASLLTLTAGTASQAIFPSYAQASNKLSEKNFAKEVLFKITSLARYKDYDGVVHMGHVYLKVYQVRSTPDFPNQLNAEMQGEYYFESDIEDATYNDGTAYKTNVGLLGDDGSVLVDKINMDPVNGNTYKLYGCSSSSTCDASETTVTFNGNQMTMDGSFDEYLNIEILRTYEGADNTSTQKWVNEFWNIETVQVPLKKD